MSTTMLAPEDRATEKQIRADALEVSTTHGSLIHWIGRKWLQTAVSGAPSRIKAGAAAVALTYVPLFIGACFGHGSLISGKASLLRDWNTAYTFLIAFPVLLAILLRDDYVMWNSLIQVERDGVVEIPQAASQDLCRKWRRWFLNLNIAAQTLGVAVGVSSAFLIARVHSQDESWASSGGHLAFPAAVPFLWSIFCIFSLIPVYVIRSLAISLFLKDLVAISEINMLPFHPDRSGGLRPVGEIGLRNQYVLSVIGINLALWMAFNQLRSGALLHSLIGSWSVVYLLLGPLVFFGPLLPFREGMLKNKSSMMSEIAQRLRRELRRLHEQLDEGGITKDDEDLIDRLRKMGGVIEELPVWPYDMNTVRKFITAYVTPAAGLIMTLSKNSFVHKIFYSIF